MGTEADSSRRNGLVMGLVAILAVAGLAWLSFCLGHARGEKAGYDEGKAEGLITGEEKGRLWAFRENAGRGIPIDTGTVSFSNNALDLHVSSHARTYRFASSVASAAATFACPGAAWNQQSGIQSIQWSKSFNSITNDTSVLIRSLESAAAGGFNTDVVLTGHIDGTERTVTIRFLSATTATHVIARLNAGVATGRPVDVTCDDGAKVLTAQLMLPLNPVQLNLVLPGTQCTPPPLDSTPAAT